MAAEIIMPKLGVDMQEGEIIEWKKQEGDSVNEGDILLEIMSDKTNMEIEAEDAGILLKIVRPAGDVVPVTEVIGYIGAEGESVENIASSEKTTEIPVPNSADAAPTVAPKEDVERPEITVETTLPQGNGEKVRATPAARKTASEMGVSLGQVPGSGPKGRVHQEDVENFKNAQPKASPLARKMAEDAGLNLADITGTGFNGKVMKEDILATIKASKPAEEVVAKPAKGENAKAELPEGVEVIKMSAMRKAISKGMTNSYLTAPSFTLNYDIDMTEMMSLRKKLIDPIMEKTGLKVSFTDLIGMAVVKTLMKPEHQYMNASLINDAQEIELHKFVNIGIAVGLDDGLIVPVVHNADKMSLADFVVASKDVIKKTQQGKLKAAEMSGSTFSITNLGMFGTKTFNPIINQPNSAILGVGATIPTPTVVNGEIVPRPIMAMCLTIDHRLVDGMNGAKFMVDLKNLMENPFGLLI
ncbi:dihydrolipoamide acetyltransferase [Streptococcus parauberis]|uniref:Dihydrolipoamide acetyltransferase component of pyruvate dehydrogenase complex n=1 Tax=Streptococcus parauberis KRS-02083 TaxID=1207545 RepID=A0ABN0IRZ4_9STRE|nr:dihydrolipoamide acetyltransferase [Streptococcus parauberis]AUT06343.1 Dihydrolipoyllysine-residue succinyltransferase [Streptococcus parauberis]EMG25648.1 Dihydrolipoamide acetyltransferase component (E2) of acetoin dehydrogenase complex [Streptococcus parauberis KRS-02083]KYP20910.1 Dihydrolipoyllysine-residue acetyltransferase component of pyruvate dehydrogenase complex [Streptococcus parauberis]KYP21294.1 Dihydrolipoyllysine-residue acetyltransferase component of pyruvate dehydrogenase 